MAKRDESSFGGSLALELMRRGTQVLAIDGSAKVVQALSARIPHVVVADASDTAATTES